MTANTIYNATTSTSENRDWPEYVALATSPGTDAQRLEAAWRVITDGLAAGTITRRVTDNGVTSDVAIPSTMKMSQDTVRELAYNSRGKKFDGANNTRSIRAAAAYVYDHYAWPPRNPRGSNGTAASAEADASPVKNPGRQNTGVTMNRIDFPSGGYVTDNNGEGDVLHLVRTNDPIADLAFYTTVDAEYRVWRVEQNAKNAAAATEARRAKMAAMLLEADDTDAEADMAAAMEMFQKMRAERIAAAAQKLIDDAAAAATDANDPGVEQPETETAEIQK